MKYASKILLSILVFININCPKSTNNNSNRNFETEKKTYYLYYTLRGDYEIYCNGISLSEYADEDGMVTASEYLNPLIHKKGLQTISIRINDTSNVLSPEYLKGVKISIYYSENGDNGDLTLIKDLSLPKYQENQTLIYYSWSFDADVDYELEDPLDSAKDLTKENIDDLQKEVLNRYNQIHYILNSGNAEQYAELYKNSFIRETTSMYLDSKETIEYIDNLKNRVHVSKGLMKPLENFKVNINPNKKIVELSSFKGKPILYSIDDKNKIKFFSLQLYRSLKTGKLEVY